MFRYILAQFPRGSARRIRTAGNCVVVKGHVQAHIYTAIGMTPDAYPVIIPLPIEFPLIGGHA